MSANRIVTKKKATKKQEGNTSMFWQKEKCLKGYKEEEENLESVQTEITHSVQPPEQHGLGMEFSKCRVSEVWADWHSLFKYAFQIQKGYEEEHR